jgi:hydrogenase nickel incorporation protein HypB
MCKNCGCDTHQHHHAHGEHHHTHEHNHEHHHEHPHNHDGHHHEHPHPETVHVDLELNILSENDRIAESNRALLKSRGIVTINLISSPGSGKTALLEKTLDMLKNEIPCAVIVGDQRSDEDAKRLRGRGAPVTQIETGDSCHLNAGQIEQELERTLQPETKLLFIENVGNLVCPAAFDLGEDFKVALLSAPEGEDKPLKYPSLFNTAKAVIITKTDLCPYLDWDIEKCRQYIRDVNPEVLIFELSSRTENGMNSWISYLKTLL